MKFHHFYTPCKCFWLPLKKSTIGILLKNIFPTPMHTSTPDAHAHEYTRRPCTRVHPTHMHTGTSDAHAHVYTRRPCTRVHPMPMHTSTPDAHAHEYTRRPCTWVHPTPMHMGTLSLIKYVLSTMGVSKESISKFLIGNRFHVKLRILSPENCKKILRVKS